MLQSANQLQSLLDLSGCNGPHTLVSLTRESSLPIVTREPDSAIFHHKSHISCLSRQVVKMSLLKQVATVVIVLDELGAFKMKRKKRGMWSKNWLLNRQRFSHMNLLNY